MGCSLLSFSFSLFALVWVLLYRLVRTCQDIVYTIVYRSSDEFADTQILLVSLKLPSPLGRRTNPDMNSSCHISELYSVVLSQVHFLLVAIRPLRGFQYLLPTMISMNIIANTKLILWPLR